MDYQGQKLSENIYYILTILFGAVAWIVGYVKGDFTLTFKGWLGGLGLSLLLCIPDWPMYNRHPVTWLEEIGQKNVLAATETKSTSSSGGKKDKEKSK